MQAAHRISRIGSLMLSGVSLPSLRTVSHAFSRLRDRPSNMAARVGRPPRRCGRRRGGAAAAHRHRCCCCCHCCAGCGPGSCCCGWRAPRATQGRARAQAAAGRAAGRAPAPVAAAATSAAMLMFADVQMGRLQCVLTRKPSRLPAARAVHPGRRKAGPFPLSSTDRIQPRRAAAPGTLPDPCSCAVRTPRASRAPSRPERSPQRRGRLVG